jgi:hypothetical protein
MLLACRAGLEKPIWPEEIPVQCCLLVGQDCMENANLTGGNPVQWKHVSTLETWLLKGGVLETWLLKGGVLET